MGLFCYKIEQTEHRSSCCACLYVTTCDKHVIFNRKSRIKSGENDWTDDNRREPLSVDQSVRGSALLQRGYMRGLDEGECGTESGWMGRQSVQVSADVRLLNSGGTGEGQRWTSQGIAPESFTPLCYNLQQNTTTSDCGGSGDTTEMENVWDVGDRLHTLGKGQLQAYSPLSVACSSDKMKVTQDQYLNFSVCCHKKRYNPDVTYMTAFYVLWGLECCRMALHKRGMTQVLSLGY